MLEKLIPLLTRLIKATPSNTKSILPPTKVAHLRTRLHAGTVLTKKVQGMRRRES
jgi:hypothetical protein